MSEPESFTAEVSTKLGHYVYRLVDPRNGETFYVGKGQGNRVFNHARGTLPEATDEEERLPPKLERIKAIHAADLKVVHIIHRHGIPKDAIDEVEAALIDAYPGLTNIQGGYGSSDRGPKSPRELIHEHGLPDFPFPPEHKLLLININSVDEPRNEERVRLQVQGWWRLSVEKAKQAEFVVAVVQGVAVGVFKASNWRPATDTPIGSKPRYGFDGTRAKPDIWEKYVGQNGKRIAAAELRHVQNPIRYAGFVTH